MSTPGKDLLESLIVPPPAPESGPSRSPCLSLSTASPRRKRSIGAIEDKTDSAKPDTDHDPSSVMSSTKSHTGNNIDTSADPLGLLKEAIPLEDYLRIHTPAYEADLAAAAAARAKAQEPPQKKQKTIFTQESPVVSVPVAAPVPTTPRSSKHVVLLNEKCQALHIPVPKFTYEGDSLLGWSAEVTFPTMGEFDELQGIESGDGFKSKQDAKEASSKKALEALGRWEKQTDLEKSKQINEESGDKGIPMPQSSSSTAALEKKEAATNYIGLLVEFQRTISGPSPSYIDFEVGNGFASNVTFGGTNDFFGSLENTFSTKKAARQDAARLAIEHIKSQGLWPDEHTGSGGLKKRKSSVLAQLNLNPIAQTQASISRPILPITTDSTTKPTTAAPEEPAPAPAPAQTFAQQVAALSARLAFPPPFWDFQDVPDKPTGWHNVHCIFKNARPPHDQPLCRVENKFGKKNAKEECAKLVLEYLRKVQRERVGPKKSREERRKLLSLDDIIGVNEDKDEGKDDDKEDVFEDAVERH